jgi:hypothetical protein
MTSDPLGDRDRMDIEKRRDLRLRPAILMLRDGGPPPGFQLGRSSFASHAGPHTMLGRT